MILIRPTSHSYPETQTEQHRLYLLCNFCYAARQRPSYSIAISRNTALFYESPPQRNDITSIPEIVEPGFERGYIQSFEAGRKRQSELKIPSENRRLVYFVSSRVFLASLFFFLSGLEAFPQHISAGSTFVHIGDVAIAEPPEALSPLKLIIFFRAREQKLEPNWSGVRPKRSVQRGVVFTEIVWPKTRNAVRNATNSIGSVSELSPQPRPSSRPRGRVLGFRPESRRCPRPIRLDTQICQF